MTLRVGIVSAAWGAMAHLPAWRALPGVEVTTICTSRRETAEAASKRFGVARAFWDAKAMCADADLDIVDCGTRPSVRHDFVLAALKAGKHVYNGVPFAAGYAGACDLHRAWKVSGKVGVVDAFSQWLPAHQLMKEKLVEGYLGEPFGGSCRFNLSLFNKPNPQFPYNWFWQRGHGVSAMRNLGSHALHMLVFLFGEIEEVVADDRIALKEWTFPDGETIVPETNDLANALLRFASGLTLQLQVSWSATCGEGWLLDVFGRAGRLSASAPSFPTSEETVLRAGRVGGAMEIVEVPERLKKAAGITLDSRAPVQASWPMALAMQAMVDDINGKGRAAPDFDQALEVERVQEAVRISNNERRWVRIREIA